MTVFTDHTDSMPQEDEETMVNTAALLFKKGKFEEARLKYEEVMTLMGYKPDIGRKDQLYLSLSSSHTHTYACLPS